MQRLFVSYEASPVGLLEQDDDGVKTFTYDNGWEGKAQAFPISLAMPIEGKRYRGKVVASFFENLIPEGNIRKSLERVAELPEGDDIAFLERFGEDCAGALSISPNPDPADAGTSTGDRRQIQFSKVEQAIREGTAIQAALRADGELPPFSLAGAQAKFPCVLLGGSIFLPRRGEPTTHIVKLPIRAGDKLLDSVHNEYVAMRLAAACGLRVPKVALIGEKIPLFAIERFDRDPNNGATKRLHTQDFCQATGRVSSEKYQRDGGPSFSDCYLLVRDSSKNPSRDLFAILDWLAFNLAIGNNDSHAKNLSLISTNEGVELSPFYDLVCTALYPEYSAAFAFKIGDVTSWQKLRTASVASLARQLELKDSFLKPRLMGMFDRISKAVTDLSVEALPAETSKTLRKISAEVEKRVGGFRHQLQRSI